MSAFVIALDAMLSSAWRSERAVQHIRELLVQAHAADLVQVRGSGYGDSSVSDVMPHPEVETRQPSLPPGRLQVGSSANCMLQMSTHDCHQVLRRSDTGVCPSTGSARLDERTGRQSWLLCSLPDSLAMLIS
jgi:hypothetical protein